MRLSIVALGDVHAEDLQALTTRFDHLEQLVLDVPPRAALAKYRGEFNRAVDAATDDWVLIVRERETITDALAQEILDATTAAKARGFRIRALPFYASQPLRMGTEEGEVRLFHRRSYLRFANKGEWEEVNVQGTIVRLTNELRSVTFASEPEHRAYLEKSATRLGALRRFARFLGFAISVGTLDRNTLRYLWNEAAFSEAATAGRGEG
jgi:hypothetical protein